MNTHHENAWRGMVSTGDFSLWRILDHTRFMIARSREMELNRYGLTPEQSHILDISARERRRHDHQPVGGHHTEAAPLDFYPHRQDGQAGARRPAHQRRPTGRKYEVAITDKGEDLVRRMTRESVDKVFASLSDEEKQCLRACLMLLMEGAYEMLGKEMSPSASQTNPAD